MDPALQSSTPQNTLPTMLASSGKRSRENETPSQRHKREKAAERQRRKRERDRNASVQNGLVGMATSQQQLEQQQLEQQQQQQQQQQPPIIVSVAHPQQPIIPPTGAPPPTGLTAPPPPQPPTETFATAPTELSAAELSRRERVRMAARERQRKHRALVKQKKLRDLGLDMGNELAVQGLEEMQYRLAAAAAAAAAATGDGSPFGALQQHELAVHQQHQQQQQQQHQQPTLPGQPDPAFPPAHNGGQTFASTLLLSFSCAPLLKQHILRTLSMTNEELASLEPIIAQAWDQWDHQVRSHGSFQSLRDAACSPPHLSFSLLSAPPLSSPPLERSS